MVIFEIDRRTCVVTDSATMDVIFLSLHIYLMFLMPSLQRVWSISFIYFLVAFRKADIGWFGIQFDTDLKGKIRMPCVRLRHVFTHDSLWRL